MSTAIHAHAHDLVKTIMARPDCTYPSAEEQVLFDLALFNAHFNHLAAKLGPVPMRLALEAMLEHHGPSKPRRQAKPRLTRTAKTRRSKD